MDRPALVDRAVAACKSLVGAAMPGKDLKILSVWWYGAVDISPKHCVVWVMCDGQDAELIPPWYFPYQNRARTDGLATWTTEVVQQILAAFAAAGWDPDWPAPSIGFESEARVRAGGGYNYFK